MYVHAAIIRPLLIVVLEKGLDEINCVTRLNPRQVGRKSCSLGVHSSLSNLNGGKAEWKIDKSALKRRFFADARESGEKVNCVLRFSLTF